VPDRRPPTPALYERAILWVTHPSLLFLRVGGLTLFERHMFTAARAGIKSIWIATHKPDDIRAEPRLPQGLEVRWVPKGGGTLTECAAPYLGLSADHLLRVDTLAHIARTPRAESVSYEDTAGLGVVQVVLSRDEAVSRHKQPLPEGTYRRLEAPINGEETVDWLMAAGPKSQDGFMARHFDRHISLSVSRRLLDTSVTPNMMTICSTALGLLGASLFLGTTRAWYIPGALLIWLHSVLDGCDGELARVRFEESPFGADLDFWGDNLVHLALFTCLGVGFFKDNGFHTLVLAAVADMGVLASAWTAWKHRLARRRAGATGPEAGVTDERAGAGIKSRLSRLENALAQRDFIYLLVLLAFVDCVYEFLWAAAIGNLLFFAIMQYLRRVNENEQAQQPHPAR
jgi:phosphatidylglycerophosphate synthase